MFSLEYCGSCANYVWQIFLRWCCFLPQCQRMCWKWPKNSWEIQFEFLWKRKNWLLKESNSFILMLKERNGSWIHFVTCTRHWQLHRLLFFSIQGARWTGSQRKCMPGTSQFLPCMVTWTRKKEMLSWGNFDQDQAMFWSLLTCWLVELMCNKCHWL